MNDGMHESLVASALWELSDDDARRHLEEVARFRVLVIEVLARAGGDVLDELRWQAIRRKYPEAGEPDPTWVAWWAWAQTVELQRAAASLDPDVR